jgi:hypothetical protein
MLENIGKKSKMGYQSPRLEAQGRYSVITGSNCVPPLCGGESLPFMPDFMDSMNDLSDGARE